METRAFPFQGKGRFVQIENANGMTCISLSDICRMKLWFGKTDRIAGFTLVCLRAVYQIRHLGANRKGWKSKTGINGLSKHRIQI
jgi:hypothetical protein